MDNKSLLILIIFCVTTLGTSAQDSTKKTFNDTLLLEAIEVTSVRASEKAPFTKTNITKSEISKVNFGQDLPYILSQTPSVVVNSDAGNGVGYTGIRIRGSDPSRINVTLNGIPYNDAESQGTFFVDMPDISSSAESIQIQRGVGTSSNGAGAFGASIHLSTNEVNKEKYLEVNNSYGSFNTIKNTVKAGSGLIGNHFLIDARFSHIASDGYIDRASSALNSLSASAAWIDANNSVRFNLIRGKEKTYQAWNGLPEAMLKTDRRFNPAGTEKPGEPYDNETDNFLQTHYQLFFNHKFNEAWKFNAALFLTRGKGYYEEYRAGQKYKSYGLPDLEKDGEILTKTDLIRQKWLDNYFYGTIFSIQYDRVKTNITFGGGLYRYEGGHYGKVIAATNGGFPANYEYYNTPAEKNDLNLYAKISRALGKGFTAFGDVQARFLEYDINGFKDNPGIKINSDYQFLNPKVGLSYNYLNVHAYASLSLATKEPNRDDYEAEISQVPVPEKLYDWELGFENKSPNANYGVTFYYMFYRDQLVNTGKMNDVGAYTRTNTPESYRAGVELQAGAVICPWMNATGNIAFSRNKIQQFTEYVDNYDDQDGKQIVNTYQNTDISFSPSTVGAASLNFIPIKNGEISMESKYVGNQYLDNTSSAEKILPSYFLENVRLTYSLHGKTLKQVNFILQANNVFDKLYEGNGWTYSYLENGKLNLENYYYPMAGINFMATINIRL